MLDSVLFELDGVLADTADIRRDAVLTTLRATGVPLTEEQYRERCAGLGIDDAVRAGFAFGGVDDDETAVSLAALRAERTYRAFLGRGLSLVDGAGDVLTRLHDVARLGIVTRMRRVEAQYVLTLSGLDDLFTCVVSGDDTAVGKPSAAPYTAALARLSRTRERTAGRRIVALEDALPGIRSARSAGIACVAVGPVPAHAAMEADAYLQALTGLTAERLLALVAHHQEPIA